MGKTDDDDAEDVAYNFKEKRGKNYFQFSTT
jgi:hypothetical protein